MSIAQLPTALSLLAVDNTEMIIWFAVGAVALAMLLVAIGVILKWGAVWFEAYMAGANIRMVSLINMSLRQVNARVIVRAKIMAKQAALGAERDSGITTRRLEGHYLAGGDVHSVIKAVIIANRADLGLTFDQATAIDLAGRNVLDAVQTSVNPKVINCPEQKPGGKGKLSAIAKDGVELRVRAQVTVRTNLERLVGGAIEETIIARVGEGIITAIGSATTHLKVLENPDSISQAVLKRGLDSQTAFQIVSIDIGDIDVGENIGARLELAKAKADMRVAQARAEERRAVAQARAQEMKARVALDRALVVEAEAEVPRAMAIAFRKGSIGGKK